MPCSRAACSIVAAVSSAISGETSSEQKPSTPAVRSWTGAKRSVASRRSAIASSKKVSSVGLDRRRDLDDLLVVGVAAGDRLVEDRRVRGQPGDRELVDVAGEGAVAEHRAGDVVEPEALAQVVQLLCGFHARASLAASATLSGVKPNLLWTSLSGAELPKVCMPIFLPPGPT